MPFPKYYSSLLLALVICCLGCKPSSEDEDFIIEEYTAYPDNFQAVFADTLDAELNEFNPVITFDEDVMVPEGSELIGDKEILCQDVILNRKTCAESNANFMTRYEGTIYYVVFPGSSWASNQNAVNNKLNLAIAFYKAYCIDLKFKKVKLPGKTARRLQNANKNLFDDIIADIKGADKLGVSTIDKKFTDAYKKLLDLLQAAVLDNVKKKDKSVKQNNFGLVVFTDNYFGGEDRALKLGSSNRESIFQIGIMYADRNSRNIMAHELRHMLGKSAYNKQGPTVTWNHGICTKDVARVSRTSPFVPYQFGTKLDSTTYEIIRNTKDNNNIIRPAK